MKSIYKKSIPLLGLMSALLLATASPIASAHSESRTRIGVGLSLFFPHVGLHLGTSTGGRGHHHEEQHSHGHGHGHNEGHGNHHGHARHKGAEQGHTPHSSSTYEAPPAPRSGPRSKRHARGQSANDHANQQQHVEPSRSGKHSERYCDRADANAARCLSEMQSGR